MSPPAIRVAEELVPYTALGVLWCDRVRVVVDAARSTPPVPPDTIPIRTDGDGAQAVSTVRDRPDQDLTLVGGAPATGAARTAMASD
jgi:hypothetical protein